MKALLDSHTIKGTATRRLFDTTKLVRLLEKKYTRDLSFLADASGRIDFQAVTSYAFQRLHISSNEFEVLLNRSAKKLFAGNMIWKFFKVHFDLDLALPYLTGYYTTKAVKANLIVTTGHKAYADQIGGTTSAAFTAIAYGTGSTAAAAGDTALGTEVARGAATVTNTTTTTTGDTEQWVKTFTAGGTQAITEEGILNNNSTGGILLARQVFSAVNMLLNDTLQFTHKIQS